MGLLFTFLVCFSLAEEPPAPPNSWALLREGKYLAALHAAERSTMDPPIKDQEVATMRSMIGDHAGALESMGRAMRRRPQALPESSPLDECAPLDALEAIVDQARDRQIVILNEAHHVPMHRAFALEVAKALRPLGYSYLAAETLQPRTDELAKRGYPLRSDGFYSAEPVFGDFLREALRMGYQPVAYEVNPNDIDLQADPIERVNQRDSAQARHLMERVFEKDPGAKVLVFVGYAHATEDVRTFDDGRQQSWMAARLAKASGLDPLTIDQTSRIVQVPRENSAPDWQYAAARGWLAQPTVFRQPDGSWYTGGSYAGRVDMQVFHPEPKEAGGRPDWLTCGGHRSPHEIPDGIQPRASGRLLVQAFYVRESDDAVPVDQVVLAPGTPRPVLMLPAGSFRLVVQDEAGDEVMRMTLSPIVLPD